MSLIRRLFQRFSSESRRRRAELFRRLFDLDEHTVILDLGSENGSHIHSVLRGTAVRPSNVYIADIRADLVREGARRYGFNPVVLPENGTLPFEDGQFDIVYCSSVIEHVTLPKAEVWKCRSGKKFRQLARENQARFASEIRRTGKQYFVQTPHKYFPIESHTWLPLVQWLPRPLLIPFLQFLRSFWVKKTDPDWHLLTAGDMRRLFPEARIFKEKVWGMTKSVMAVKSDKLDREGEGN
ncbi:MAG: methyltransferase domain-containing protein [Chlorobi bacterium]|nr:methyltransferase domain-containing protein [Chlorobiota bacterium]